MPKLSRSVFSVFLTLLTIAAHGQKKLISYDQAFKNKETKIFAPLPTFVKWLDDDHLVIKTSGKMIGIALKTKQSSPYTPALLTDTLPGPDSALPADISNYTLSPNKRSAAYAYKNNLFVTGDPHQQAIQLTFDGNDSVRNGLASWVYEEEITGSRAFWWSNNSRYLVFMRFDESNVPVFPLYVSDGQHGYLELQRYPKAGNKNPKVRIGIINLETRKTVWADFNEDTDQYFGIPYFTPDNQLYIQWINRGQDNLKVFFIDPERGSVKELYDEKQSTWVALNNGVDLIFPEDDSSFFILRSDKSGWPHFYLYSMNGQLINPITTGNYSVGNILKIDEKRKVIYFTARKENSARWGLYSVHLNGKGMQRLSFADYSFSDIHLSPGNKYFIATYSSTSTPSGTAIIDMKGKVVMELGNIKGADFQAYALPRKELLRVRSTDGKFDLPLTITYPVNFDSTKKYPVVMSVYGGPNAGKVYDSWNMPLADIWWAQEGLIQVGVDNRSSGHFGKTGMNYIHRRTGIYEIEDFMAAGRWLKQQAWMDTSKLCITGVSFGGYMTCMALTYGSGVFNYGIAYWGITDWKLYDTHYTERYMDSPAENPEGYGKTAVTAYASNYKGMLRIVHGAGDNNAHPQNILQLIDRLQDLNRSFEFMLYPGERHGFHGKKWLHNKNECARFYYQYLLNKKVPASVWE